MGLICRSAAHSDRGGRADNQDALLADDAARLWLVADGVASSAHGGSAARETAEGFTGFGSHDTAADAIADLRRRIVRAHDALSAAAAATTLCLLHIVGERLTALWIGDSRLYRWRDGALQLLTHDHTLVARLVADGTIATSEAGSHPLAHVLTQAIGAAAAIEIGEVDDAVAGGDRFLLCTDGLHGALDDAAIASVLATGTAAVAAATLLAAALASPRDNVTLVVVDVDR